MRAVGARSETDPLRAVLLHRPGRELARLTPRNSAALLFDGLPWLSRAQEEHDCFADVLRSQDVEVLYLTDLLATTFELEEPRLTCIEDAVTDPRLSSRHRARVRSYLADLHPDDLVDVLVAGLTRDELPNGAGLSHLMMDEHDFVVPPLPNLLFTRDSSVWIGDRVAVTSLAMPARRRETSLTSAVFSHHPRLARTPHLYDPGLEPLEGGDVLLLGDGVVAIGTGERTSPAGVERLAVRLFQADAARAVLAVPIEQRRATMHLDTVCTMVDRDAMLMYPAAAHDLHAYLITAQDEKVRFEPARPFLEVAARALGLERMHVIDTGLDPVTAEREQWDDGNNTLAVGPRRAIAYERNVGTNERLERAGIEVLTIPGSELGSGRGGPRCMSAPIRRDPAGSEVSDVSPVSGV